MLDQDLNPRLRVSPPDPYVYKSASKREAARLLDALGELWLSPPARELDWKSLRRVAVLRLDHLGDLLNAFPTLEALRRRLPKAWIELFVGPWGAELAKLAPGVDTVHVVEAPWFQRPQRVSWPWAAIAELGSELRNGHFELGIELRGDLRHHLALAYSGIPLRLGHAVTAGRFLLTHPGRYQNGLHEIDQNLALIGAELGAKVQLKVPPVASQEARRVMKELGLSSSFVAIQAACGSLAKRWIPGRWAELIQALPKKEKVVLLGAENEREEMEGIAAQCGKRAPKVAAGRLSLLGLAAFLEEAKVVLSVDSGPAHFAAALGTPLVALYSGTNRAEQWGPRGERVEILRAEVPCSPCELSRCPYANECMRRLEVPDVLKRLEAFL